MLSNQLHNLEQGSCAVNVKNRYLVFQKPKEEPKRGTAEKPKGKVEALLSAPPPGIPILGIETKDIHAATEAHSKIPERPKDAPTGKEFIKKLQELGGTGQEKRVLREQMILAEISRGNIPDFLRQLKPITVQTSGPDGVVHKGTIFVMPDYLAVGSDNDFVRMPMTPLTAQKIADNLGCIMPTKKIIDQVHLNADTKVPMVLYDSMVKSLGISHPKAYPPKQKLGQEIQSGTLMMSNEFFQEQDRLTQQKLDEAGHELGQVVSGIKKELVITNRLLQQPGNLAFYGGMRPDGSFYQGDEQGVDLAHEPTYADYSHGARLVSRYMEIDGKPMDIVNVLQDPVLSKMLTDEGTMDAIAFYRKPGDQIAHLYAKSIPARPELAAYTQKPATEIPEISPGNRNELAKLLTFGTEITPDISRWQTQISEIRSYLPPGYDPPTDMPREVGILAREILNLKQPMGTMTPFKYNDIDYLAVKEWHGPDSGNPKPHPSISIFQLKEGAEAVSTAQLQSQVALSHATTQTVRQQPAQPEQSQGYPDGGAVDRGAPSSRRPSYGGGGGEYQPALSYATAPAPSYSETSAPSAPYAPAQKPVEGIEGPPTIPYTSLGDSIMVGTDANNQGQFIKLAYHESTFSSNKAGKTIEHPEMVGKNTTWMLQQLKEAVLPSIERTGIKTIILGGGGNDILVPLGADQSTENVYTKVTNNLRAMYQLARGANLNVVAITMPPFDRHIEANYHQPEEKERHYMLWERVNQFIMSLEGTAEGPNNVVRTHELLQNPSTPRKLDERYTSAADNLHPTPSGYKVAYAAIEKAVNEVSGQQGESPQAMSA